MNLIFLKCEVIITLNNKIYVCKFQKQFDNYRILCGNITYISHISQTIDFFDIGESNANVNLTNFFFLKCEIKTTLNTTKIFIGVIYFPY